MSTAIVAKLSQRKNRESRRQLEMTEVSRKGKAAQIGLVTGMASGRYSGLARIYPDGSEGDRSSAK